MAIPSLRRPRFAGSAAVSGEEPVSAPSDKLTGAAFGARGLRAFAGPAPASLALRERRAAFAGAAPEPLPDCVAFERRVRFAVAGAEPVAGVASGAAASMAAAGALAAALALRLRPGLEGAAVPLAARRPRLRAPSADAPPPAGAVALRRPARFGAAVPSLLAGASVAAGASLAMAAAAAARGRLAPREGVAGVPCRALSAAGLRPRRVGAAGNFGVVDRDFAAPADLARGFATFAAASASSRFNVLSDSKTRPISAGKSFDRMDVPVACDAMICAVRSRR